MSERYLPRTLGRRSTYARRQAKGSQSTSPNGEVLSFDDQLFHGVPVAAGRSKRTGTLTTPAISGRVSANSEAIAIDGLSGATVVSLGPSRRIGSSGV